MREKGLRFSIISGNHKHAAMATENSLLKLKLIYKVLLTDKENSHFVLEISNFTFHIRNFKFHIAHVPF